MKIGQILFLFQMTILSAALLIGCRKTAAPASSVEVPQTVTVSEDPARLVDLLTTEDHNEENTMQIQVNVNGTILTAQLENNTSAQALYEKLKAESITIEMRDYANFEKVGSLGFDLPRNDTQITTKAGDIILYQGSQLVFYYDTNSWDFTKLGEFIDVDPSTLKNLFGEGNITAVLSLE